MSTRLFVLVPSGNRKSCDNSWSGVIARALISALAFFRVAGSLLSTKMDWMNSWHAEMRKASGDSSLLTGEVPDITTITASRNEECGAPTSTGASCLVDCFPTMLILKPDA